MKRFLTILLSIIICFSFALTAYADDEMTETQPEPETTVNSSQPRLMVSAYKLTSESVTPNENTAIEITFKNYSNSKAVYNIKLSLLEESGEIRPSGTGTQFVNKIAAGGSYTWKVELNASKTAQIGEHKLTASAEYEDEYYSAFSSSDTLLVNVMQSVSLDYSGIELPKKVTQDSTVTAEINLMNTGKSALRNAKVNFDIEGIDSGSVLFIGEIPAGESKSGSTNLRVSKEILGDVSGTAVLSYEDEFGTEYSKEINISTKIEEKIETENKEETEKEQKYPLWWAFLLTGAVIGGAVGFIIPTAINASKKRKEDELRL